MKDIKGIIFDYGGTIDTRGDHWSEVLWDAYVEVGVPVSKVQFREAFVFGERALAKYPFIRPDHNFMDLLLIKLDLELSYLECNGMMAFDCWQHRIYVKRVSEICYQSVLEVLKTSREVIRKLSETHKLVLVSNFYGNIQSVLKDFELDIFFPIIIESAVVGVRKPDPAIYQLGVDAIQLPADEVLVVGDSYRKDMVPARQVGCHTAWIKGREWEEEHFDESLVDVVITDLSELLVI